MCFCGDILTLALKSRLGPKLRPRKKLKEKKKYSQNEDELCFVVERENKEREDASEVKETEMEEEKHKLCEETDKQSQTSVKRDGNSEETHSPETHWLFLLTF